MSTPKITGHEKRRVSFEIEEELFQRMSIIQWGFLSPILRVLLLKAVEAVERGGTPMAGCIIDGQFKIVESR